MTRRITGIRQTLLFMRLRRKEPLCGQAIKKGFQPPADALCSLQGGEPSPAPLPRSHPHLASPAKERERDRQSGKGKQRKRATYRKKAGFSAGFEIAGDRSRQVQVFFNP